MATAISALFIVEDPPQSKLFQVWPFPMLKVLPPLQLPPLPFWLPGMLSCGKASSPEPHNSAVVCHAVARGPLGTPSQQHSKKLHRFRDPGSALQSSSSAAWCKAPATPGSPSSMVQSSSPAVQCEVTAVPESSNSSVKSQLSQCEVTVQ